jgi:hypothetical protein
MGKGELSVYVELGNMFEAAKRRAEDEAGKMQLHPLMKEAGVHYWYRGVHGATLDNPSSLALFLS